MLEDFGVAVRVTPNYEDYSCTFAYGELPVYTCISLPVTPQSHRSRTPVTSPSLLHLHLPVTPQSHPSHTPVTPQSHPSHSCTFAYGEWPQLPVYTPVTPLSHPGHPNRWAAGTMPLDSMSVHAYHMGSAVLLTGCHSPGCRHHA
eukprot:1216565-Pyramimonas_sp.AAC.1